MPALVIKQVGHVKVPNIPCTKARNALLELSQITVQGITSARWQQHDALIPTTIPLPPSPETPPIRSELPTQSITLRSTQVHSVCQSHMVILAKYLDASWRSENTCDLADIGDKSRRHSPRLEYYA